MNKGNIYHSMSLIRSLLGITLIIPRHGLQDDYYYSQTLLTGLVGSLSRPAGMNDLGTL